MRVVLLITTLLLTLAACVDAPIDQSIPGSQRAERDFQGKFLSGTDNLSLSSPFGTSRSGYGP
jgi:hypothetical protein